MAAVAEISVDSAAKLDSKPNNKADTEFNVQKLVDMFTKLNPLAKEFVPSSHSHHNHLLPHLTPNHFFVNNFLVKPSDNNDNFSNNRRVCLFLFDLL